MTRRTVPHTPERPVDSGPMSTKTQVHNGGATPVVLDDTGHVLYPGDTAQVEVTARVSTLLDQGAIVHVPDTQTKPARATKEQE